MLHTDFFSYICNLVTSFTYMKKAFAYFGIALAALSLQGCSDNEDSAESGSVSFGVSQQSFSWDSNVNEQALLISASSSWTASTDVEWCKPRKASGRGSYNLSLWVSPNITSEARSGQLTIKSGTEMKTVSIEQPAYTSDTTYTYRLPVIFHVLYNDRSDNEQYIPQNWLAEVLDSVNANYRRNGMGIEFCMAAIDQDGDTLSEAGVMRHQVSFTSMDCDAFLASDNTDYGYLNQNFRRYINIFTFKFSEDNTMGITTLPCMPTTRKMDGLTDISGSTLQSITALDYPWGVALNNSYIYESQPAGYINPLYIVTTLSHELGHYLGLLHTFSEDECNDDDYCDDTKNCDYNAYIDGLEEYFNSLGAGESASARVVLSRTDCEDGESYYADNILDYMYTLADDLTSDQQERTRQVMNYCPMVPGPKLETYSTASSRISEEASSMEPRLSGCPDIPPSPRIISPATIEK